MYIYIYIYLYLLALSTECMGMGDGIIINNYDGASLIPYETPVNIYVYIRISCVYGDIAEYGCYMMIYGLCTDDIYIYRYIHLQVS